MSNKKKYMIKDRVLLALNGAVFYIGYCLGLSNNPFKSFAMGVSCLMSLYLLGVFKGK